MRLSASTVRWLILAAVILPIAFVRVRRALMSTESRIEVRIESVLEALEDRRPKRISGALADDFVDEQTGYGRAHIADAARGIMIPGTRYRATVHEENGIEIVEMSPDGVQPKTATVRVRCLLEQRPSGSNAPNATDEDFEPWWDMDFTADLERQGGVWMFVRTRDVNHDSRPW